MIITEQKIRFYMKIDGDLDLREPLGKYEMTTEELYELNSLVQDIRLMNRGLLSEELKSKLLEKLSLSCADEKTKNLMLQME
jgi:hypothetical protein